MENNNNKFQPVLVNFMGRTCQYHYAFMIFYVKKWNKHVLHQCKGTFSQRNGTPPTPNHCPLGGTLVQWVFAERIAEECGAVWQQQGCAQLHGPPWSEQD